MGYNSKIEWTQATWNCWQGCHKVSAGCANCYMYRDKERFGQDPSTVIRSKTTFDQPLKWSEPRLIFVCSWSDFFIKEADPWRDEAWDIIRQTPKHTYQILTKRPERILSCLPNDWDNGWSNVWLGISAENQEMADKRIPILAQIPAKVRFLSLEPLLNSIYLGFDGIAPKTWGYGYQPISNLIHQVIVGGESGPNARPMHPHGSSTRSSPMMLGPFLPGPNDTEENGIYVGDAKILTDAIPPDSVNLIFTDPVYKNIIDYEWLAWEGLRILKPNSACLAWCSKVKLPECQQAMADALDYETTLFYVVNAKQATPIFPYGVIPWTTPCLRFAKGRVKCDPFIPDTYIAQASELAEINFKWQKNSGVISKWLEAHSKKEDVVFDPFTGYGVVPHVCKRLGRRYLAFELDPIRAQKAHERVNEAQLRLEMPMPEQLGLI